MEANFANGRIYIRQINHFACMLKGQTDAFQNSKDVSHFGIYSSTKFNFSSVCPFNTKFLCGCMYEGQEGGLSMP